MEFAEVLRTLESWIKDLSAVLKVELHLDEEGICTFQVGEETILTIEASRDHPMVNIYSSLAAFPAEDNDASVLMMAKALELNAFQTLTRGGAIGAIPGEGILIFCYSMPTENGDSEIFINILGNFIETASELKAILMDVPSEKNKPKSVLNEPGKKPFQMIKI